MAGVSEDQLVDLFGTLVRDLNEKIRSGDATGKDKELALKMINDFQIGLSRKQAKPLDALREALPFDEMKEGMRYN